MSGSVYEFFCTPTRPSENKKIPNWENIDFVFNIEDGGVLLCPISENLIKPEILDTIRAPIYERVEHQNGTQSAPIGEATRST